MKAPHRGSAQKGEGREQITLRITRRAGEGVNDE